MRGVYGCLLIAAYGIGLGGCSLVLDPSEHGAGGKGGDDGGGQQADSGDQSDAAQGQDAGGERDGTDVLDAGDGDDASDPFVPPEGCEDPDVDEACLAIDCGALSDPEHGEVTTADGTTFGQVADYSCEDGYGVVGVSRRTCRADGEWSDAAPACEVGDCPTLQSPDNGVVNTPEGTTVSAEATYSCNLGYVLSGDATRSCGEDHTWSGAAPSCAFEDECASGNPCGEGSCVNGTGWGYDCDCSLGYESSSGVFPVCEPRPVLSLTGPSEYTFPARERGTDSEYVEWVITNVGMAASGVLSVESEDEDFELDSGCDVSLGPGQDCVVRVRFTPESYGTVDDTITVRSALANEVEFTVRGSSQVRITVEISGTGTVTGEGIDCPGTCSALFDHESDVTLAAHTANGSNHYLSGWDVDDCTGPARECVVWAGDSRTVGAVFSPMTHNLVFVTSGTFAANLGGAAAYDVHCNAVASDAGLNNAGGNGFIAATSDTNGRYTARLTAGVQGWVRLDGRAFAATAAALETQILNPVRFDEHGWDSDTQTWAGNDNDVEWANCDDWSTLSTDFDGWMGHSNAMRWTLYANDDCDQQHALACIGNTRTAALNVAATPGKRIWLSAHYMPGTQTPDARCFADRPNGVAAAVALIAYTDRTAASVLDPGASYVRPDGQLVGTGQDLIDGRISAGIWQLGDGSFNPDWNATVWSGSFTLGELGRPDTTCENWTSTAMEYWGLIGDSVDSLLHWWIAASQMCGGVDVDYRLYCVEP